jgi:hypothetical protein
MRAALLAALLCALLPAAALADDTVATLMGQAQRAFVAGDYDTARELFGEVIQLDPQNTVAIQFLRTIRARQAGQPAAPKNPFDALVLSKVDIKDATFSSALDFFKQKAADQSVTVSFVPQLPEAQMEHTVTLNLSNIPFLDALRYLCQLNDATYKVEPYAIVIKPASADSSPDPGAQ